MRKVCPKCTATMGGPKYDGVLDLLRFICSCGYTTTELPADKKSGDLPKVKPPFPGNHFPVG